MAATCAEETAGSKAARTELVRILIAKDIFDGCEPAMKAVYRALVAASRQWATDEQVTAVRRLLFAAVPNLGTGQHDICCYDTCQVSSCRSEVDT